MMDRTIVSGGKKVARATNHIYFLVILARKISILGVVFVRLR